MSQELQAPDLETATTALEPTTSAQPDSKTRRYDRQLRLWAASGQSALESARILVLTSTATSTLILKNLILPGIGHYTILDDAKVTPEDIGNNFFLQVDSVGKGRAEESVKFVGELNESVDGKGVADNINNVLKSDPDYLQSFTLIIAHNLDPSIISSISRTLDLNKASPPFIIVRSAGFLAEFFIQFHEHQIIESHPETSPSLRIDKPFPELLQHSRELDLKKLDQTDQSHVPYVILLVKAMGEWKSTHNGSPPKSSEDKKQFKSLIRSMGVKGDQENIEEAESKAFQVWTPTTVPFDIRDLFDSSASVLDNISASSPVFYRLLWALREFTKKEGGVLPLTATLPDMHCNTENYIHLQKMYKTRSAEEKEMFKSILQGKGERFMEGINDSLIDDFVKNSHGLRVLRGKRWGEFDRDLPKLSEALTNQPKETSLHLALTALDNIRLEGKKKITAPGDVTIEELKNEINKILGSNTEFPEEVDVMLGEIARAPTAEIPTVAAFLGGVVSQEAIKMITKQYVPQAGYCVIDLVGSETGVLDA